jgi:tetratricopeptide (TPR) repeat protein
MSSPFTPPHAGQEIAPPSALELIWVNHRGSVIGVIAGVVILGLVFLGITVSRRAEAIASETLFATATDAAGWNGVISKYPGTPAAADAMLLLAASLRDAGKIEESDRMYSRFTETFPRNPLAVSGLIGRASNARVAGKTSDAFNDYQQAASAFPQSYGAPFSLLSQARLLAQEGKQEEVKRIIQTLGTQYPGSLAALAAGIRPQLPQQAAN